MRFIIYSFICAKYEKKKQTNMFYFGYFNHHVSSSSQWVGLPIIYINHFNHMFCSFSVLRLRRTPDPVKLFDASPFITDYEFGNLKELSTRAMQNEVSFVMYCKSVVIWNNLFILSLNRCSLGLRMHQGKERI